MLKKAGGSTGGRRGGGGGGGGGDPGGNSKTIFWKSEDGTVAVRIKPDRDPLIWIAEKANGKLLQRCQIKVKMFKKQSDGVQLMTELAKLFVAKSVALADLYKRTRPALRGFLVHARWAACR